MTTAETLTVIALLVGPLSAVGITLWHQRTTRKYDAKERLFLALMAHRRSNPPTFDWANSLNLIDVVFADNRPVVDKWHELYDIVIQSQVNWAQWNHTYIDLLSEMATALGYNQLRQTDIDRYYTPTAHGTQAALNQDTQTELLRILKATGSLQATPRLEGGK